MPHNGLLELHTRQGKCGDCGCAFEYQTIGGIARTLCPPCCDRDERETEQQRNATRQAEAKRDREARVLELLADVGANPAEHGRATLDSYEGGGGPVEMARRFLADIKAAGRHDPVKGLYLYGGTGTGKTHLAVAVLRDLLVGTEWGVQGAVYDHASLLMARIQATYGGKGDTMELLERRFRARVWILDDLGTERATPDVAQHLTLIFTMRAMRPTLVTSNFSPAQFEAQRPELERVVSRMGHGYFRHAEVKGHDRRFD
jgi:DNA replication protein DnaC